ncbi:hypothetical protein ACOSQ3_021555 [Xanthoceras sorbifolium]
MSMGLPKWPQQFSLEQQRDLKLRAREHLHLKVSLDSSKSASCTNDLGFVQNLPEQPGRIENLVEQPRRMEKLIEKSSSWDILECCGDL